MRFKTSFVYKGLALLCSLLLLTGCETSTPKAPGVEERAKARWETLLAGDLGGAYEYLSPGYRSSVSSLQYQRSLLLKRVRWTSAKYIESECEETTCKLKFSLGYSVSGALPGVGKFSSTEKIYESWVLADGEWYFVPEH